MKKKFPTQVEREHKEFFNSSISFLSFQNIFQMNHLSAIKCLGDGLMKTPIHWNLISYKKYVVHSISFQNFFIQVFKIIVDSWQFTTLLLYILWDDWPIFMISGSNEQLQQQLEYNLVKLDCHSWWISKMQS